MTPIEEMEKVISSGSTWVTASELSLKLGNLKAFPALIQSGKVIYHKALSKDDVDCFSFPVLHQAENDIATNIIRLIVNSRCDCSDKMIDELIAKSEKKLGITLHEEQHLAVEIGIKSPIMILTGGAGTGKTCVLQVLQDVFLSINPRTKIVFTAPTGKASRRITESVGSKAYTLNKKLGIYETNVNPTIQKGVDVLISDEMSMADIFVASALFKALENGTKLILVGDVDQLPSVGAGNVLDDLITSGIIPTVMLTKTFRQAGDSYILMNAQKTRNRNANFETDDYFHMMESSTFEESAKLMLEETKRYVAKYGIENVACLVPFKAKGVASAKEMNRILQETFNPKKNGQDELQYFDMVYRVGDIVMQLKNRKECVNGEVGKVINVNKAKEYLVVQYVDSKVIYWKSELNHLTLAYAMTIHKSQGSEYKAVVTCFHKEHGSLLTKKLLYTTITRAKQEISVIATKEAIQMAVMQKEKPRFTLLVPKIRYEYQKYLFDKSKK